MDNSEAQEFDNLIHALMKADKKIERLGKANKILRDALENCESWFQANIPEMECNIPEVCDHCEGQHVQEELQVALERAKQEMGEDRDGR